MAMFKMNDVCSMLDIMLGMSVLLHDIVPVPTIADRAAAALQLQQRQQRQQREEHDAGGDQAVDLIELSVEAGEVGDHLVSLLLVLGGGLGLEVDLAQAPGPDLAPTIAAFSESPTRLVVAVSPVNSKAFEAMLAGVPHAAVGRVVAEPVVTLRHGTQRVAAVDIGALDAAFRGHS